MEATRRVGKGAISAQAIPSLIREGADVRGGIGLPLFTHISPLEDEPMFFSESIPLAESRCKPAGGRETGRSRLEMERRASFCGAGGNVSLVSWSLVSWSGRAATHGEASALCYSYGMRAGQARRVWRHRQWGSGQRETRAHA